MEVQHIRTGFQDWVNGCVRAGHFPQSKADFIFKKFEETIGRASPHTLENEISKFKSWAEDASVHRHLHPNSLVFLKQKIDTLAMGALHPMPPAGRLVAPPVSASLPLPSSSSRAEQVQHIRTGFQDWVNGCVRAGHFTQPKVDFILKKFEETIGRASPHTLEGQVTNFKSWAEDASVHQHLHPKSLAFLKQKIDALVQSASYPMHPVGRTVVSSVSAPSTLPLPSRADMEQHARMTGGRILFYDAHLSPLTNCFGNFFESPVLYNGQRYRCAEAAYQAQKFPHNPALQAAFCGCDGDAAWRLASAKKSEIRPDWKGVNENYMFDILKEKYTQNPKLKDLLLATGDSYLVEHTPGKGRDAFWADDSDGTGQNKLGQFLMILRGQLGGVGPVPRR